MEVFYDYQYNLIFYVNKSLVTMNFRFKDDLLPQKINNYPT